MEILEYAWECIPTYRKYMFFYSLGVLSVFGVTLLIDAIKKDDKEEES